MILAVDLRNGGVSVGVCTIDGQWRGHFRLAPIERSADEWCFVLTQMLAARDVKGTSCSQAILSSVVPAATPAVLEGLRNFLGGRVDPLVVGPGVKTGLRIRTDNPAEVGSDLVCNAVAASALVGYPAIVVDFSTVLSFTIVDRAGDLVGVVLAPGLEAAVADLRLRAAQIPQIRLEGPYSIIGKNTAESIRAGILYGWSGLLERIIEEISKALGGDVHPSFSSVPGSIPQKGPVASPSPGPSLPYLVGTGWYEKPPIRCSYPFTRWDPHLTLEGLYRIALKNRAL